MSNLIQAAFEGSVFQFNADGYINATEVAKKYGKRLDNWLVSPDTKEYIEALEESLDSRDLELVIARRGFQGGTWLHPDLAVVFARWISPKFAVWCDQQIKKILRGEQFANPMTTMEMILASAQHYVELERRQRESEERQEVLTVEIESQKKEIESLKQGAKDLRAIPFKTMRTEIVEMARAYSWKKKMNFGKPWAVLYKEFNYRYKINLKVRAKNANMGPLDWAEKNGQLHNLYNLALELFKLD